MKEQLSVNRAGHMMSEPQTLNDLAEALHHEIRETRAHYDGVTNQNGKARDLFAGAEAFAAEVPHAPQPYSAADLDRSYLAAAARYHEGMAQALMALKVMQSMAEKANGQHETVVAMKKQQDARTGGRLSRFTRR